ncbi:MAG: FAD-dependent oxidoreductase [Candidatus Neomarinimicrobiota bacterium]
MHDLAVIGGGVIGLAVAHHFQTAGQQCLVVEREETCGQGISSRNSEVLHAGFYYPTGSLKAKLCVEGRKRLIAYLRAKDLPFNLCGKYVVATVELESELEGLHRQGETNGAPDLEIVTAQSLHQRYPELTPLPALFSPGTGVLSADALIHRLAREFQSAGGDLAIQTRFVGMNPTGGGYEIVLEDASGERLAIEAERVVNAAGLNALAVATAAGFDYSGKGYELRFCQGAYFKVPAARGQFQHLIYPLPTPNSLGVHIKLDLQQEVSLGPDARYLPTAVEDYSVDPGLAPEFRRQVRPYWPAIDNYQLVADWAGIRPHLFVDGELHHDFYILDESATGCSGWVNLFGIDSPGLTAALAFGPYLAQLWN